MNNHGIKMNIERVFDSNSNITINDILKNYLSRQIESYLHS